VLGVWVPRFEEVIPFSRENVHEASVKTRSIARPEGHDAEGVFHVVGRKEGELILIAVTHCNLVISAASVEADKEEFAGRIAEVVNGIFASRDRVFEGKGDTVEFAIGYAHTPNEILDIGNVFLMRLGSEDDKGTPRAITFADPAISRKDLLLFKDDPGFVGPIARLATANRLRAACVNGKFKPEDRFANTSFVEDIPIFLYHHFYFTTGGESNVSTDANVLVKFGCVSGAIPEVKVGASRGNSSRDAANRIAVLGEDEEIVVDVVAIIERDITISRLGSPDLGRNVDHQGLRQGSGIGR